MDNITESLKEAEGNCDEQKLTVYCTHGVYVGTREEHLSSNVYALTSWSAFHNSLSFETIVIICSNLSLKTTSLYILP